MSERQEQPEDVSKAGNWAQISHIYSNKSNHHYCLAPNPISLPSFKIFPTDSIIKLRLSCHLFPKSFIDDVLFQVPCQEKNEAPRWQSKVQWSERARSSGRRQQYYEASKTLCILKAWKLNTIINQCKLSTSQCYLVYFHREHHFHKKMLAQSLLELATFSRNVSEVMKSFITYGGQK